jgi:hypothetical protein
MIKIGRPKPEDAPEHCKYFFSLTNEDNLIDSLENSKKLTVDLIKIIPSSLEEYCYADGKWNVKMVFSHVVDAERLYCFNAMLFSRKDNVAFADWCDRDTCALNANTTQRSLSEINEEFLAVRDATIKLFGYMTDEMLDFRNKRNNFIYTPRSLGWMITGHNIHHCRLIKEKYLRKQNNSLSENLTIV